MILYWTCYIRYGLHLFFTCWTTSISFLMWLKFIIKLPIKKCTFTFLLTLCFGTNSVKGNFSTSSKHKQNWDSFFPNIASDQQTVHVEFLQIHGGEKIEWHLLDRIVYNSQKKWNLMVVFFSTWKFGCRRFIQSLAIKNISNRNMGLVYLTRAVTALKRFFHWCCTINALVTPLLCYFVFYTFYMWHLIFQSLVDTYPCD